MGSENKEIGVVGQSTIPDVVESDLLPKAPTGQAIPKEIVGMILSNLKDPRDIVKAGQVNSAFRELSCGGVKRLTMAQCDYVSSIEVFFPDSVDGCVRLVDLGQLQMLWKKCHNVKELTIRIGCSEWVKFSQKFLAMFSDLNQEKPKNIEHLTLKGFVLVLPETANLLDLWGRNLKSLRLSFWWVCTDAGKLRPNLNRIVDSVAVNCGENLEILRVDYCENDVEMKKSSLLKLLSLISTFAGLRRFILASDTHRYATGRWDTLTKMVESIAERHRKFPNRKFGLCCFGFLNELVITAMGRRVSLDAVTELRTDIRSPNTSGTMEIVSNNAEKEEFDKLFRTFPNLEHCFFNVEGDKKRNVGGMISSFLEAYECAENKRHLDVVLGYYYNHAGHETQENRTQEREVPMLWRKMKNMSGITSVTSMEISPTTKYSFHHPDHHLHYDPFGDLSALEDNDEIETIEMKTKFVKGAAECMVLKRYPVYERDEP